MKRLLLLLALLLGAPALAEINPRPGEGDPHLQTVSYDANEVVALRIANGYALTVQFAPDERVETVTLGDSNAWQVTVAKSADRMVIKPVAFAQATNLTVFSDQRVYNFTLYGGGGGMFGIQPYLLRFTYPAPPKPEVEAEAPPPGRYKLRGDKALWPIEVSDDAKATSIRWADDATMPAVYREEKPGQIALVNGVVKDGVYVIEGVYRRLVFVLGKDRATANRIEVRKK